MKLDAQVVGNVGLYYVCYKLSRLGWNVMPTARNARATFAPLRANHPNDLQRVLSAPPAPHHGPR